MNLDALYIEHHKRLVTEYARVLTGLGFDAVVLHSGRANKRTSFDDQYFALRPTPHFQHWVAIAEPDLSLAVFADARKPELTWPTARDYWERPRVAAFDFALPCFDLKRPAKLEADARPRGRVAFIGDALAQAAALDITDTNPPELVRALDTLRVLKSTYEMHCLRTANVVASRGHSAVTKLFASGDASELDMHLAYLSATQQDDPETPYKNIVALGENAAILHHIAYGRETSTAPSLLVDAGATYLGYCSDITRTWVRGSGATVDAFSGLVSAVEASQKRLCERAIPGRNYQELHDEALRDVAQMLKDSGIVRASVEEIDARGISRAFLPHGLGHSLGLQCHDVGCALVQPKVENPYLRNTSIIEEGQVFTIEPGIYFIDMLLDSLRAKPEGSLVDWAQVAALAPLGGIRIEDDLRITATGHENMTRDLLPVGGGRA